MARPHIDFGRLTAEETGELARECLRELTEADLFEVLNDVLTKNQKDELRLEWEESADEEED